MLHNFIIHIIDYKPSSLIYQYQDIVTNGREQLGSVILFNYNLRINLFIIRLFLTIISLKND